MWGRSPQPQSAVPGPRRKSEKRTRSEAGQRLAAAIALRVSAPALSSSCEKSTVGCLLSVGDTKYTNWGGVWTLLRVIGGTGLVVTRGQEQFGVKLWRFFFHRQQAQQNRFPRNSSQWQARVSVHICGDCQDYVSLERAANQTLLILESGSIASGLWREGKATWKSVLPTQSDLDFRPRQPLYVLPHISPLYNHNGMLLICYFFMRLRPNRRY